MASFSDLHEDDDEENEPTVAVDFHGTKPPTYDEVSNSMPLELYHQRTEEMKTYGIHYLDKLEADFSDGDFFTFFFYFDTKVTFLFL